MGTRAIIGALLFAGSALAADLPPHAVDVGYGTWTCDRGYLMRGRACVDEREIPSGSQVEVTEFPSAVTPWVAMQIEQARRENPALLAEPIREREIIVVEQPAPQQIIVVTGGHWRHGCEGQPGWRTCW